MNEIFSRLANFAKLANQAFGQYKWQIITLTTLSLISGILEGIGINSLIPLFSFVLDDGSIGELDFISKYIEKFFNFFDLNLSVKYLLILIVVLFVFKALFKILFDYIQIRTAADYENKTRKDLFKKMLAADWPY